MSDDTPSLNLHITELELHGLEASAHVEIVAALREALAAGLEGATLIDRPVHIAELALRTPAGAGPARVGEAIGAAVAGRVRR